MSATDASRRTPRSRSATAGSSRLAPAPPPAASRDPRSPRQVRAAGLDRRPHARRRLRVVPSRARIGCDDGEERRRLELCGRRLPRAGEGRRRSPAPTSSPRATTSGRASRRRRSCRDPSYADLMSGVTTIAKLRRAVQMNLAHGVQLDQDSGDRARRDRRHRSRASRSTPRTRSAPSSRRRRRRTCRSRRTRTATKARWRR